MKNLHFWNLEKHISLDINYRQHKGPLEYYSKAKHIHKNSMIHNVKNGFYSNKTIIE
jgi:hypothetical protein